jgi:hypothetical protein
VISADGVLDSLYNPYFGEYDNGNMLRRMRSSLRIMVIVSHSNCEFVFMEW